MPGFPVPETTDMLSGLAKLNYQINDRNRLTGFYSRQHRAKHNRNANALLTEESTWKEDDRFWITQMTWNSIVSDNAFLEAAIGYQQIFFPALQKGSEQSLLDLSSGLRTRAAPVSFLINWPRLQSNANLQYFVPHALGGRHELRVGIQYWHAPTKNVRERIDDLDVTYRSTTNTASTVNLWNSPRDARANVDELAIYFQGQLHRQQADRHGRRALGSGPRGLCLRSPVRRVAGSRTPRVSLTPLTTSRSGRRWRHA